MELEWLQTACPPPHPLPKNMFLEDNCCLVQSVWSIELQQFWLQSVVLNLLGQLYVPWRECGKWLRSWYWNSLGFWSLLKRLVHSICHQKCHEFTLIQLDCSASSQRAVHNWISDCLMTEVSLDWNKFELSMLIMNHAFYAVSVKKKRVLPSSLTFTVFHTHSQKATTPNPVRAWVGQSETTVTCMLQTESTVTCMLQTESTVTCMLQTESTVICVLQTETTVTCMLQTESTVTCMLQTESTVICMSQTETTVTCMLQTRFRVLPGEEYRLMYNFFPLVAGQVALPRLHVNMLRYPGTMDDLIYSMLPSHIFIRVSTFFIQNVAFFFLIKIISG